MVVETPHRAKQSKPHPIYDGTEADPLLPQPVSLPWIYFVALCIVVIITADMANSLVQAPEYAFTNPLYARAIMQRMNLR